jgi:hypothetical protein
VRAQVPALPCPSPSPSGGEWKGGGSEVWRANPLQADSSHLVLVSLVSHTDTPQGLVAQPRAPFLDSGQQPASRRPQEKVNTPSVWEQRQVVFPGARAQCLF